ncbi:MBL fold metallo-hydrolase [Porticoccaceae bacterium]|uniref:MBL fold metallo-hydrolase n=1 Tax=SAR92 clade bacterium H455 TaxID=2974818 RepID=A0ABY5TNI7_9GAMM|nr:MBL fold metallo-hydrolase [Porticoccaceae bacterium]UVW35403.1 MBL fold metallo-hydrolase [SAR92 clade bacterium H455]
MIFRQLFDPESSTYSYLLGDEETRQAILIDSVLGSTEQTLLLLEQLDLRLSVALDTHTHADHITGLGALRDRTGCTTMMGEQAVASCLTANFKDGDQITAGNIKLEVIYSPGHTDDSYSFYLPNETGSMLFSGDTLLIRGTGRTDFQNGDAEQQYNSLFNRLLKLPDSCSVYPGHDYKGWTMSTIGEEKRYNPRLQIANQGEYVDLMDSLDLPSPKLMDVAVPANQACGDPQ